jgi:hypothetical protein
MNRKRKLAFVIPLTILTVIVIYTTPIANSQSTTPLFSVNEVISDQDHPLYEWVYKLHGRVAKSSQMSASIWSLRSEAGTALIVSAIHTLGEGYLGPSGTLIEESLMDPAEKPGATRIHLVKEDGSVDSLASVLFILYHPEVPAEENGNNLRDILPIHDFFVGVIDSQKVVMEPLPNTPEPLKHESPTIFDPSDLTTDAPTYADVTSNESVILMGYPLTGEFEGKLAANIGRVLSDTEAEDTIEELAELGDEEGGIAYVPEVEMIIEGYSVAGMSGGGVYNSEGKQVGILVRASYEYDGKQYIRAVRMTYLVDSLMSAYEALSHSEKAVISPYLESTSTPTPSPIDEEESLSTFVIIGVVLGVIAVSILIYFSRRK